jgi:hypothetical protein
MTEQLDVISVEKQLSSVIDNDSNVYSVRLNQSLKIGELMKALCKASLSFGKIEKDKMNPHFKSSYASLDSIIPAVKSALLENNLYLYSYFDPLGEQEVLFITQLVHADSEQWMNSIIPVKLPANLTPQTLQGLGSLITYLRRYSIGQLLNLNTDEDDDGNNANVTTPVNTTQKPKPTTSNSFQSTYQPDNKERVAAFSSLKTLRASLGIDSDENKAIVEKLGYTAMKDIPMDKMGLLEQKYKEYAANKNL